MADRVGGDRIKQEKDHLKVDSAAQTLNSAVPYELRDSVRHREGYRRPSKTFAWAALKKSALQHKLILRQNGVVTEKDTGIITL